jgi:hypothetical protein
MVNESARNSMALLTASRSIESGVRDIGRVFIKLCRINRYIEGLSRETVSDGRLNVLVEVEHVIGIVFGLDFGKTPVGVLTV